MNTPKTLTPEDLAAYAADSAPDAIEAENVLSKITRLVREHKEATRELAVAEKAFKEAGDRVRVLEEITLVDALVEAQQLKLVTSDGDTVEKTETLRASIPAVSLPAAVMWLKANGAAAIVKRELKLEYGTGEEQRAAHALEVILEEDLGVPTDKQFVHPMTLAATIKELITQGVDVPMALLGAHVQSKVKIKPRKT